MAKKVKEPIDYLDMPGARMPTYGTGEVATFLGAEIWRIQKYLDSPKYRLSPTGKLGSGKGSRRVFTLEDVYRLGVAEHLVRNGFSYKFVSEAVQQLEDEDLLGYFDSEGEEMDLLYMLSGGEGSLRVKSLGRNRTIGEAAKAAKTGGFYVIDLGAIQAEIVKRMQG